MAAQTGEWMDNIAINWLVWIQTGSPLAHGHGHLVRGLPTMLFSLVGGVVADRVDRRALMMSTRLIGLAATATMAAPATFEVLQLWALFTLLVVRGNHVRVRFAGPSASSAISCRAAT